MTALAIVSAVVQTNMCWFGLPAGLADQIDFE